MSNAKNNPRRLEALQRIEAKRAARAAAAATDDKAQVSIIAVSLNMTTGERTAPRVVERCKGRAEALARIAALSGGTGDTVTGYTITPRDLEGFALARAAR